jgi:hypothetical protein
VKSGIRTKHTFRLPPALASQLADYAARKRVSQAMIVETALASFLSPDGAEQMDKLTRQADRLDYHVEVTNEALALFIRFWLTANAPLPDTAMAAAQAKGKERYDGFVEALARKMESGTRLAKELSRDLNGG